MNYYGPTHMDPHITCHSGDLQYLYVIHNKISRENCPKMLLRARLIGHVHGHIFCPAKGISGRRKSDLKMKGFDGAPYDNVARAQAHIVLHRVHHLCQLKAVAQQAQGVNAIGEGLQMPTTHQAAAAIASTI